MTGPLVVTTEDALRTLVREAVRAELADREPVPEWLDTKQAAALLGRHPKSIAKLAKAKELPGTKLGNAWRFRRADCLAYLEGGA